MNNAIYKNQTYMNKITIEWKHGGTKVMFASSINRWTPTEMQLSPPQTGFIIELSYILAGIHQYKFIVDGKWCHDTTKETIDDGHGGKNNILKIQSIGSSSGLQYKEITPTGPNFLSECTICFTYDYATYKLKCDHIFCVSCLRDYIINKIDCFEHEIVCPNHTCGCNMSYQDITELVGSFALSKFDKNIVRHTVRVSDNLVFCPKCETVCKKNYFDKIQCSYCDHEFCFRCGFAYNDEHTCDDINLGELVSILENVENIEITFKQCPNCDTVAYKPAGCDCVKCPSCRYRYCWNCLTLDKDISNLDEHNTNCTNYQGFAGSDSDDPVENNTGESTDHDN